MPNEINAPGLATRQVTLRPLVEDKDLNTLFEWRNDPYTLYLWEHRCYLPTFEQFKQEFYDGLTRSKRIQMMIDTHNGETIGTVFSYDPEPNYGYASVGIYLKPGLTCKGLGPQAMALFMDYLFTYYPFRKIYVEVYEFNQLSQRTARKFGFVEEGCLKDHRYLDGKFWDMRIFAYYRDKLPTLRAFINRCKGR